MAPAFPFENEPNPSAIAVEPAIIGLILQSLIHGAYLVTSVQTLTALERRRRAGERPPLWLWIATASIFVLSNMFYGAQLEHIIDAFSTSDPSAELLDERSPGNQVKVVSLGLLVIVTDAIMVYMTYIIWNRSMVVSILPLILLGMDAAVGIFLTVKAKLTHGEEAYVLQSVADDAQVFYYVTLALNLLCAGLMSWKIWRTWQLVRSAKLKTSRLSKAGVVIVESASVQCVFLVALILMDNLGVVVEFTMFDMLPSVMAIVFSLVINRAMQQTENQSAAAQPLPRYSHRETCT